MEQRNKKQATRTVQTKRATFVEVFDSIRFEHKASANASKLWPEPGFAVNKSTHHGEAAPDDYKQLVRSSN